MITKLKILKPTPIMNASEYDPVTSYNAPPIHEPMAIPQLAHSITSAVRLPTWEAGKNSLTITG